MQFGLCARLNRLEEAAALGFDYLELPLRELAALSAAEFDALLALQRRLGVKLPAFNCLLPGSIRLFAQDFSLSAFDDYLELVFSRAEALGGRCAVFSGSDEAGWAYAVGCESGDLRGFVRELNAALQGRGGGKPNFAQGRLSATRSAIEEYLQK